MRGSNWRCAKARTAEVKNVLMALGLEVNRLIRVSFGPFQLGDLPVGGIEVVKARVLKDQLGKKLADKAEADFDSEMPEAVAAETRRGAPTERQAGRGTHTTTIAQQRFRFTDRAEMPPEAAAQRRKERAVGTAAPRGKGTATPRATGRPPERFAGRDADQAPERRIHFDDGREPTVFEEKTYGKKPRIPRLGADGGAAAAAGVRTSSANRTSVGEPPHVRHAPPAPVTGPNANSTTSRAARAPRATLLAPSAPTNRAPRPPSGKRPAAAQFWR